MMRNKPVIAITGGIGSGKSTFCELLRKKGYSVFSCDRIYSELLEREDFLSLLKASFPACVDKDGLNRRALSKLVFSDENALKELNAITHPAIIKEIFLRANNNSVSFAEVPLLYEEGLEKIFRAVIALRRSDSARITAVQKRDGLSEQEIVRRIERQFCQEELSKKDCILIENDGTIADLEKKSEAVIEILKNTFPNLF